MNLDSAWNQPHAFGAESVCDLPGPVQRALHRLEPGNAAHPGQPALALKRGGSRPPGRARPPGGRPASARASSTIPSSSRSSCAGSWWNVTSRFAPALRARSTASETRLWPQPTRRLVLLGRVLGVVDQEVGVGRQVVAGGPLGIGRDSVDAQRGLVVGQVGHRRRPIADAVADRLAGVDHDVGIDRQAADLERLQRHVVQLQLGVDVAQANREERRRQVASQPGAQILRSSMAGPRRGPRSRRGTAGRRSPGPGCGPCAGGSAGCPAGAAPCTCRRRAGCPCRRRGSRPCRRDPRSRRTPCCRRTRRCPVRRWRSSRACPTGRRASARWLLLPLPEHRHATDEVAARADKRICSHFDHAVLAVAAPNPDATVDRPAFAHRHRQRNLFRRQVVAVLVANVERAIALLGADRADLVESLTQQSLGRLVEEQPLARSSAISVGTARPDAS